MTDVGSSPPSGIVALDPSNPRHVRAAAELHAKTLPQSPVPALGDAFMRSFYYSRLVEDGLVQCDLYRHDREFVGFIAYTGDPFGFMGAGARRHVVRLALQLAWAVMTRPSRLRVLSSVRRDADERGRLEPGEKIAELLSFGVLDEYRGLRDESTGARIPSALLAHVRTHLERRGFSAVQMAVEKSNRAALLFYRAHGARIDTSGERSRILRIDL